MRLIVLLLLLLSACDVLFPAPDLLQPTRVVTPMQAEATPAFPARKWTGITRLKVSAAQGAWLRSEPDHLAIYQGMPVIAEGTAVRVIGTPYYEVDPGQWWWLVDAETGDIGWVEETSLTEIIPPQRE